MLAKDGAYTKAVTSQTSEIAALSPDDQMRGANQLLPMSTRPELVCTSCTSAQTNVQASVQPAAEGVDTRQALQGVKFPAMFAAGPSGCRPEHIKGMLSIWQRSRGNKLRRAISALRDAAENGDLPRCARWIFGSRLVFIENS